MKAESTTVTYYEHFIEKMIATDMAEWTSKTKEFPEKILDELLVHIKEFLKKIPWIIKPMIITSDSNLKDAIV